MGNLLDVLGDRGVKINHLVVKSDWGEEIVVEIVGITEFGGL